MLTRTKDGWKLNCLGMLCPVPIVKLSVAMSRVRPGEQIVLVADDLGIEGDLNVWCRANQRTVLEQSIEDGVLTAVIQG